MAAPAVAQNTTSPGPSDVGQGTLELRAAAERGDAMAQNKFGLMHMTEFKGTYLCPSGQNAAKNSAEAIAWFRKAADQGLADAQNNLGFIYEKGCGVAQDSAQAETWYRKAADQDLFAAQDNLFLMYADGHGVAQDYAKAAVWFCKMAVRDYWTYDASKKNPFGRAMWAGVGPYDIERNNKIKAWLRKAATDGDPAAQHCLDDLDETRGASDK